PVSVSVPPVGGNTSNGTVNVSVRELTAGEMVLVSVVDTTPFVDNVIGATPPASDALMVTASGLRGSTSVPAAGLLMLPCGVIVSMLISAQLVCPAMTVATADPWTATPCWVVVAVTVTVLGGRSTKA